MFRFYYHVNEVLLIELNRLNFQVWWYYLLPKQKQERMLYDRLNWKYLQEINSLNLVMINPWWLSNDFLAFRVSINLVFYFVQDPYMYQFDYLDHQSFSKWIFSILNIRLRLSISNRGCSIPTADRKRLLLILNVCK